MCGQQQGDRKPTTTGREWRDREEGGGGGGGKGGIERVRTKDYSHPFHPASSRRRSSSRFFNPLLPFQHTRKEDGGRRRKRKRAHHATHAPVAALCCVHAIVCVCVGGTGPRQPKDNDDDDLIHPTPSSPIQGEMVERERTRAERRGKNKGPREEKVDREAFLPPPFFLLLLDKKSNESDESSKQANQQLPQNIKRRREKKAISRTQKGTRLAYGLMCGRRRPIFVKELRLPLAHIGQSTHVYLTFWHANAQPPVPTQHMSCTLMSWCTVWCLAPLSWVFVGLFCFAHSSRILGVASPKPPNGDEMGPPHPTLVHTTTEPSLQNPSRSPTPLARVRAVAGAPPHPLPLWRRGPAAPPPAQRPCTHRDESSPKTTPAPGRRTHPPTHPPTHHRPVSPPHHAWAQATLAEKRRGVETEREKEGERPDSPGWVAVHTRRSTQAAHTAPEH